MRMRRTLDVEDSRGSLGTVKGGHFQIPVQRMARSTYCCFENLGLETPYPRLASVCYANSNYNNNVGIRKEVANMKRNKASFSCQ